MKNLFTFFTQSDDSQIAGTMVDDKGHNLLHNKPYLPDSKTINPV